jgi:sugar phosphate isomerase/epimerase
MDWVQKAGSEAVSFHAHSGVPGHWQGIDPAVTGKEERRSLRKRLSEFLMCEIHAPFDYSVRGDDHEEVVKKLRETIEFAGDVGAHILTIHANPPRDESSSNDAGWWQESMTKLDGYAKDAGIRIGLELTGGFEQLENPGWKNIGVTLDVGHMYLDEAAPLKSYGTIGAAVRAIAGNVVQLHMHDYDGDSDHLELGAGHVDIDDTLAGLAAIHYRGAICLEMNPARVSPDGIRRSASLLRMKMKVLRTE